MMMNLSMNWRDKRNFMTSPHFSTANYSTDTKKDMKTVYAEDLFPNNLYLSPDCLRKNLADTIITTEKMASKTKNSKNMLEKDQEMKVEEDTYIEGDYSRLAGITSFFSGVLNVISNAVFSKRKPADFNSVSHQEMALPPMWPGAKILDENKILQDDNLSDVPSDFLTSEMSDCRSAAAHCRSKLDQVRVLLGTSKPPSSLRVRRRPKKVFVEASSVEDCFEDAFSPEDFENLANDPYYEFSSPICYHEHVFHEVDGPKVKVEAAVVPKDTSGTSEAVVDYSKVQNENTAVPELTESKKNDSASPKVSETPPNVPETVYEPTKFITEASESPPPTSKVNEELSNTSKDNLVCETTEIVKNVPELDDKLILEPKSSKTELVESCEDKITKLKLLLQERKKKSRIIETKPEESKIVETQPEKIITLPEPESKAESLKPLVTLPPRPQPSNKVKDKRFKNPNRSSNKRRKCRMRKNIQDDALFANEIHTEDLSSSIENSPSTKYLENYMQAQRNTIEKMEKTENNKTKPQPIPQKDYFNEVTGCFQSASVDSEDSFQIVFSDSPRVRYSSDCDSEDSFIIFEESPDSCYTNNDVFGDSTDSEDYDSDSDMSDSGCGSFKLSASLSKSVCNLADDSLYEENENSGDEVDCANLTVCDSVTSDLGETSSSKGLLLDDRKKLLRKGLPAKKVHFSTKPPKVHLMHVWLYSARQTRLRYWEKFAVDRERFKNKISNVDMAISWVLKPQHRARVMFQRFMPWWHAQRRKEIAEKKEREEAEKLKEEERLKNEEIERENAELNEEGDCNEEGKDSNDVELELNSVSTVDSNEGNINLNTEVQNEKKNDSDTLNIKEINCQNTTDGTEKCKNIAIENTKNTNKFFNETYSDKIVPLSNKIIELNSELVSGISNA